ncbi:hypothetical protein ACIRYZ_21800 [Kitasatospora sp. NPDC101155]|uniref:hypothetical protein n=1 Tax=Kitasatospora sp. NPDC101155 TaxID=3364097 RepID=UPI0038163CBB
MKIVRRLTSSVAALGLASVGVVGLGATSAHATTNCIPANTGTDLGAQVDLCVYTYSGGAHLSWSIGTEYSTTDERMNFTLASNCYNGTASVNDFQKHAGDIWVNCASGPFQGSF